MVVAVAVVATFAATVVVAVAAVAIAVVAANVVAVAACVTLRGLPPLIQSKLKKLTNKIRETRLPA